MVIFPLQFMVIFFCNHCVWSIVLNFGYVLQLQDPKSEVVVLSLILVMDCCLCSDARND